MTAKALLSDESLALQLRDGNAEAFAVLAERYGGRLAGFAGKVLGSQAAAEDVVQEVFIKVWQRPEMFDPNKARFRTWVHRVVMNRCLDQKRRKQGAALDDVAEPIADEISQDDAMIRDDRDRVIRAAIEGLPPRQKAALALCYLDGMSNQDAADVMELNIKALESLLTRARVNLKKALIPMKEHLL